MLCRRKERRKNIKRKRRTRRREKVKKKGTETEVMGNTEKRKRKRISTGTRRINTRTKRRTRTGIRIKRKAASLRREELPFHLGLLVGGNFMREMNIKIGRSAQRKGEMNIKKDTLAQRKPNSQISFMSSAERSPLRPAYLLLRQRTQNLRRSWIGGSEMKRKVHKVSWQRDLQLSGEEMKSQTEWASKFLEIWLTGKRIRRREDLITIRWTRKHSGVNIELELMQHLPVFLQWQRTILKDFPDQWNKMLGTERKHRNLRKDVTTSQEKKTRIKKGKSTVMESKKTRKKRRKRKRSRRIKMNTREAGRINQKTTIRMILLFLVTISLHWCPKKILLVRPPRELSKRERMLKLMVSCMVSLKNY